MAIYTHLQQKDVQDIADRYALTLVGFEPLEGGAGNSNYLLHTRQGAYVLTVFEDKTGPHVVDIGRLLLLLADCAFPTTRLRAPAQGGLATRYKDKPVLVKEYIAGQVYRHLNETMLEQIGLAIARLHQVPTPDFLPDKHAYSLEVFTTNLGRNINPSYESWLAKRLDYLARCFPSNLPRGLIHGDVFYDNVVFEGKELRAIIDFEQACCYYKAFDLGIGIVGLCAEGSAIALDKARALVQGYQSVRMLEKREKEALQGFVDYAATATSSWRFWKYNIDTPIAEKANKHCEMVRLADAVSAIPKARFLEAIFD